jgi:probable HAF family extracellular repeat protein
VAFQRIPLLFVGIGLFSAQAALAQQYTLTVHGDHVYYEPHAINAAGQVVGQWGTNTAFIWSDGMTQNLGRLPGTDSCRANAINDGGQVVGSCQTYRSGAYQSFLWTADTGMTALAIPGWSEGMGINNQGHIVGWYSDPTHGAPAHAFLYRNGAVEDLGPGHALGINDTDQVVGYNDGESAGTSVARLWDDRGPHDLDDEGGVSQAFAITGAGIVAGYSSRGGGVGDPLHAVLWTPYGVSDLGTLSGSYSEAFAINGDLVVGSSSTVGDYSTRAFLYDTNGPGYAVDLNDLISPSQHRLYRATGINAAGQIVGVADCCGETEFFLLTPVPPLPPPR